MRRERMILSVAAMAAMALANGQVSFVGDVRHAVITETPSSSTGLGKVYVVYDTQLVKMQYTASSSAQVNWYKFGASGGAYAELISDVKHEGNITTLESVIPNSGYIIEEGTTRTYLWVVNYADYYLHLQSISVDGESDCSSSVLNVTGSGKDITYYTINGGLKKLDRQIALSYNTLEWNQSSSAWVQTPSVLSLSEFKPRISMQAPYCNTTYELRGDKYLTEWGETQIVSSEEAQAKAVAVNASATQETKKADNQSGSTSEEGSLGGSAPATIDFVGYPTDAVENGEWQMSYTQDFAEIEDRYSGNELQMTFEESGTTYWRYIGGNAAGCEAESDVFTVSIGESSLKCPNAFSPGATEGVNDEWKVSYKSIVKFKCWIFNSWGVQMCELTDPSQGWDGKYRGKVVGAGVYYYVIDADGSDGKHYKLKGDINVVGLKRSSGSGSGSSTNEGGE